MPKTFRIATWNVNSLRVRLPHVLQWLESEKPDVLALQELKLETENFPLEVLAQAGYQAAVSGQRTYNGVAILSREPMTDIVTDISGLEDVQRRLLGVSINNIRIFNLYVPNGESITSQKYIYKLAWLQAYRAMIAEEQKKHKKIIILGDFNIAPHNIDVYNPQLCDGHVLFSQAERQALEELFALGFLDCFRHLNPESSAYSWWDYRLNAFKRNMGFRIDHILASSELAASCLACYIDKEPRTWDRPSDHAPVVAEFSV